VLSILVAAMGGCQPAVRIETRAVLDSVSPDRLRADVDTLAGFGTRHTLSETVSDTRGIGAARRWLKAEFERATAGREAAGLPAARVSFDTHIVEPDGRRITRTTEVANVMCVLPGVMPEAAGRLYYVIAHYDSRASDVSDTEIDAPGANDDASGVALCLELARVLSEFPLDATVVLMPVAGEEQGLYGARAHARAARAADGGAGLDIRAVLSNDMVGDPSGPGGRMARREVRVFSEGLPAAIFEDDTLGLGAVRRVRSLSTESDSDSRQLARAIAQVADWYGTVVQPRLVFRPDRFLRGGDHSGFNEQGFAAVRFTEVHESYDRQHQDVRTEEGIGYGDLPEHVDPGYLADVTRLNAATLIVLANAPSVPGNARVIVARLSNETTLRWDPSPEPDTAGYEVVWRATTDSEWTHARDVGPVNEFVSPLSKDNWFFGVRSYDSEGYRSPVAFPRAAGE
jgi:hypothetical protein